MNKNGSSTAFTFTRELDQNVRLSLGDAIQRSYIVTGLNTVAGSQLSVQGGEAEVSDADVFEMLAEDTAEAFVYSFGSTLQTRFVGPGFRLDDGASPIYAGLRYDVYFVSGHSATQSGAPTRNKAFLFESKSKLLSFTRYQVDRGNGPVNVEVAFSNWSDAGGPMTPTTIVRNEDGQTVLSLTINSSTSSGTQSDGLFSVAQ